MVNSPRRFTGAGWFGLIWLVLNTAGWGLGFGLEFLIVHSTGVGGLATLLGSLIAAAIIGLAQWLALRWLMPRMATAAQGVVWVTLTMFGFAAGFVAGALIAGMFVSGGPEGQALQPVPTFISWATVGAVTALVQWSALRFMARGMAWWVIANAVGFGVGAALSAIIRIDQSGISGYYALTGLIVGICTLAAISRLRQPAE